MSKEVHNQPKILRRYVETEGITFRKADDAPDNNSTRKVYRGLASRTGVKYELFSDSSGRERYFEIIEPGAFKNVLADDVRVLFNHDDNKVLGRVSAGTAKVFETEAGLEYEWVNDDSISYAADLAKSIERGDVRESSFGFTLAAGGYMWEIRETEDGWTEFLHIIKEGGIEKLYDVSPVTFPANPNTFVNKNSLKRSLQSWLETTGKNTTENKEDHVCKKQGLDIIQRGITIKSRLLQS